MHGATVKILRQSFEEIMWREDIYNTLYNLCPFHIVRAVK